MSAVKPSIPLLFIDDESPFRQAFERLADANGYQTDAAATIQAALTLARGKNYAAVVVSARLYRGHTFAALTEVQTLQNGCALLLLAPNAPPSPPDVSPSAEVVDIREGTTNSSAPKYAQL